MRSVWQLMQGMHTQDDVEACNLTKKILGLTPTSEKILMISHLSWDIIICASCAHIQGVFSIVLDPLVQDPSLSTSIVLRVESLKERKPTEDIYRIFIQVNNKIANRSTIGSKCLISSPAWRIGLFSRNEILLSSKYYLTLHYFLFSHT